MNISITYKNEGKKEGRLSYATHLQNIKLLGGNNQYQ